MVIVLQPPGLLDAEPAAWFLVPFRNKGSGGRFRDYGRLRLMRGPRIRVTHRGSFFHNSTLLRYLSA